jgi:uncharacterized protein (TIGR02449 family)
MNDSDLIHLELQIETLLHSREQLQIENSSLRQKLLKLTQERAELLDKNKRAVTKIKRIISQLRNGIQ